MSLNATWLNLILRSDTCIGTMTQKSIVVCPCPTFFFMFCEAEPFEKSIENVCSDCICLNKRRIIHSFNKNFFSSINQLETKNDTF